MNKKIICILYGGRSGEHEVSLRSAASIALNLDPDKYGIIPVAIDKSGKWFLQRNLKRVVIPEQGASLKISTKDSHVSVIPGEGFFADGKKLVIDAVFPVLHGTFGEDGTIQGLLEIADIPYIGSGVLASSLAINKEKTKRIWRESGLPTVDFKVVHKSIKTYGWEKKVYGLIKDLGLPVFVKPSCAGSSVGITKVKDEKDLAGALEKAFRFDTEAIIERAVTGREIECSVIGNRNPESFPPGEIIPKHEFYDYEAKYTDLNGAELVVPALLEDVIKQKIMDLAAEAYTAVGAAGFARVDFFIENRSQKIYLNEINTIPGFTTISMFPKLCEAAGLPYPKILEKLIQLAFDRYNERKNLSYDFS
ncbi:MAG: D-alanine--D-alanine ligase [Spirochaetes bacterium]|nr:D-alanine--D-alanine ligase [Spirochaetota bacterium]